jgi:hypothetical protein
MKMFLKDFTFRKFLENCYGENRRRMSQFDAELLRPTPRLAEVALSGLRLWRFGPATKTASTWPA